MIYLNLFLAFLQIGAFSFGGGYAAMPLIQAQVIERYGWLTVSDFTDLVTIAEMTPGPIAVNAATFVGNQVAGVPGALAATLGCILPSCIFVTTLAWIYTKYRNLSILQNVLKLLRPAVVAMIFTAGLAILIPAFFAEGSIHVSNGNLQIRPVLYFAAAMAALRVWKAEPIKVMVSCGIAELIVQAVIRLLTL
ncbi:MAG: chromate transporter [Lachnospiraceae bacterium]|nr:chromate transporter [Lachnospiraceae bacterium]